MYCPKCGVQIPNEARFCPDCGEAVKFIATQGNPYQSTPSSFVPLGMAIKPKKTGGKRRTILIVSACVFVLACAILIPVLGAKEARYKEAIALMDSGEVPQAQEAFIALGNYKESDELSLKCRNMLDFDAAKAQMDAGEYAEAKQAFVKLGDYDQASKMAIQCQDKMDYDAAVVLMDANNNEKARDAFLKLGNFEDSAELAKECKNRMDYDAAKALMENHDYQKALFAFRALADYSDSEELTVECQNKMDYEAATIAFDQGKYYTAYIIFKSIGDYADSATCANACYQTTPKNGEVYRNPAYSSKKCSLTISTAADGYDNYLKFYTDNDELVATVFIASGQKARIKLPVGTYKIKAATGMDWFGAEEMFGDEGFYQLLTFGNDVTTTFKSNYTYTLSLRSVKDGNVGGQPQDRKKF